MRVPPTSATAADPIARRLTLPSALLVALACVASFALSWARLGTVWQTGAFYDSDDAMRLVEVRDWLAGQGWFDMVAHRLAPPAGLLMHWSRVVDVPLGLLVRLFELVAPAAMAERLARIIFPLSCQVLLILAFVRASRVLCGPGVLVPALLVITFNGFQFGQFMPGRIDHHAPQIVLLTTFVGMALAGLRGAGRWVALGCAATMALSLGISLENLPFMAVTITALAVCWLWRGDAQAAFTRFFGLGLAACTTLVFLATVPPARYATVANDALSAPHVLLALLGGTGLALVATCPSLGRTVGRRCASLGMAGILVAAAVLALCPGFPASPYAGIDPVVREIWLAHVSEAWPLAETIAVDPSSVPLIVVPLAGGLLAALAAAWRAEPDTRPAWVLVVALVVTGVAGACWETRVVTSTLPLAALGGVWAVTRAAASPGLKALRTPALRAVLASVPFCPVICALLPWPDGVAAATPAAAGAATCREPVSFKPLATLAPGLTVAPVDLGAQLLVFTDLSVLAAPYHRNNTGNRAVLDDFGMPLAWAEAHIKAGGVRYVVICRGDAELADLARRAPTGLAGRLLDGETPPWLERLTLPPSPFDVYQVR